MFSVKRTKLLSIFLILTICLLVLISMSPAAFAAVSNGGHEMNTTKENSDHSSNEHDSNQKDATNNNQENTTVPKPQGSTASNTEHSSDSTQEHSTEEQGHSAEEQGHSDGGHGAKEKVLEVQSGDYKIQLITPEIMYEGENNVKLLVTKENLPVKALNVKLLAEMDKSDSSMNMNHGEEEKPIEQALSESQDGEYTGKIVFDGDGNWVVIAQFLDQETTFEIQIEPSGPNWPIVSGFLVVIFSIILTAGILKYKAAKEGISNVSK